MKAGAGAQPVPGGHKPINAHMYKNGAAQQGCSRCVPGRGAHDQTYLPLLRRFCRRMEAPAPLALMPPCSPWRMQVGTGGGWAAHA